MERTLTNLTDYHSAIDFTQTIMTYNKFSTLELAKNIKVIPNTK